jgi:hypothetical protein
MTTTDIVLHTGRELAVQASFATAYPAIAPTLEAQEMMLAILGDEQLEQRNLPRIKVPSSDSNQFTFELGGKSVAMKKIKGIMVHYIAQRSYWVDPDPKNNAPDCSSSNNKTPEPGGLYGRGGDFEHLNPTGQCANCPMAQKGSDAKGGRMAACKEQRRLFIVLKDTLLPVVVTVPPSSISGMRDFLVNLAMVGKGWWTFEIELTLEKVSNVAGTEFNKLVMSAAEEGIALGDNEIEAAKSYQAYLKGLIAEQGTPAFGDEVPAAKGGFSVGDSPIVEDVKEAATA